jgi:dihydroorotase
LTLERMVELVATNPRRIFGLDCGADTYTIVDMKERFVIDRSGLRTQCGWSPFEGMRVVGRVKEVWIRGQRVFDGEQILVPAGFGANLYG